MICPICSRRNWAQLEHDVWRLEKWLELAEGTQSNQTLKKSNIEKLEDVIQQHKKFVLDLESHKSIINGLNVVGAHLAEHTEETERAQKLREKLDTANKRWNKVNETSNKWQETLRVALLDNQQFRSIVQELSVWLERTESTIKSSEPIDLTDELDNIRRKFNKFK